MNKTPMNVGIGKMLVITLLLISGTTKSNAQSCCSGNLFEDFGFEASFAASEQFPNNSISTTINALNANAPEWYFTDGTGNLNGLIRINDATRASEGNQFAYLKTFASNSKFNRCIGNQLTYVTPSAFTCALNSYTNTYRYVASFDYLPFNQAVPDGGPTAGRTAPNFEYSSSISGFITLYDALGNDISQNGALNTTNYQPAVAWADVKNSWKRAYGVTPALSSTYDNEFWVSHSKNGTSGMLVDNTRFELLSFTDARLANVSCTTSSDKITFTLNPNSNVGSTPNIKYDVTAPIGFTVSPTQGIYGQNTTFTLTTITDGDFSDVSPASVNITVSDEINTLCSAAVVVINPYPCCNQPSGIVFTQETGNCVNGILNDDAKINFTGIINADKAEKWEGSTYVGGTYSTATATVTGSAVNFDNLKHNTTYTFRFWNADNACYKDVVVTTLTKTCATPCPPKTCSPVKIVKL